MDAHTPINPTYKNSNEAFCIIANAMERDYKKARILAMNPSREFCQAVLNALVILKPYVGIYPTKTAYNRRMCAVYTALNTLAAELGKGQQKRPTKKTALPSGAEMFDNLDAQARFIASNPPQGFKDAVQTARAELSPFAEYFPYFTRQGEAVRDALEKLDRVAMDLGFPRSVCPVCHYEPLQESSHGADDEQQTITD